MRINPEIQGRVTRLASGNVGGPRVSGDGSTVVWNEYVDGQWDILRNRDGKTEAVAKGNLNDLEPSVSYDGKAIAFSRWTDESSDIYLWRDGKAEAIASTSADEMSPSISQDGKSVVYTYDDATQPIGFDIKKWENGAVETITDGGPVDTDPMISENRIFFRRKVKFDGGDLWMRDERGTIKPLTRTDYAEVRPTVNPAGTLLAWSEDAQGDHDLYLYNVDNRKKTLISGERGVDEMDPTISADASTIAWTHRDPRAGGPQVYLKENDRILPLTLDGSNAWPQLSQDGKVITWVNVDPDGKTVSIYKLERD